jgi:hypothetical protein
LDGAAVLARLALPAVVTALLAFNAGGYFVGVTALTACALIAGIVLRLTIADRPWEGWSPALALCAGAAAGLAVLILASGSWSGSAGRAVVEFDRALLYLAALVLGGTFLARAGDLAVLLRCLAAALGMMCGAALLARLAPGTFPTDLGIAHDRLTFPLTYWNALGIASAVGLVLSVHVAASAREPALARVLAAAAAPVVVTTLYFTFSRGGIAAAAIGVIAYVLIGHPRGSVPALLAIAPTAYYALREAYAADLLATSAFADTAAAPQRAHVLLVVAACALAAGGLRALGLLLDRRLARIELPARTRGRLGAGVAVAAALALTITATATDLPRRLDDERREFARGTILPSTGDLRDRLGQLGNNGRIANWQVAIDAFEQHRARGWGAGTYRLRWEEDRPRPPFKVSDAHSLYLETAAELGVAGLVLLAVALLTPLVVVATRLRGPERHAAAAFMAAGGALLLHAGVDWDWEMPALFFWYFAASGVVLAARERRPDAIPGRLTRLLAALACLVLMITPALVLVAQRSLDRSTRAFARDDCRTAVDAALDSIEALDVRPEPFEILGYCDARAGAHRLAVAAMRSARRRDPGNWQFSYGLAVAQALAGEDPRPAARLARDQNPLEPLAVRLERELRRGGAERRRAVAARAQIPFE